MYCDTLLVCCKNITMKSAIWNSSDTEILKLGTYVRDGNNTREHPYYVHFHNQIKYELTRTGDDPPWWQVVYESLLFR